MIEISVEILAKSLQNPWKILLNNVYNMLCCWPDARQQMSCDHLHLFVVCCLLLLLLLLLAVVNRIKCYFNADNIFTLINPDILYIYVILCGGMGIPIRHTHTHTRYDFRIAKHILANVKSLPFLLLLYDFFLHYSLKDI